MSHSEKSGKILDELAKLSPFLANLEKEEHYVVPDGYFERLTTGILEKTKRQASVIHFWRPPLFIRLAGVAAVLLIVFLSIWIDRSNDKPSEDGLMALDRDEIINYVIDYSEDFELNQILEISINEGAVSEDDFLQYNEEYLNDYILENIDDIDESLIHEIL